MSSEKMAGILGAIVALAALAAAFIYVPPGSNKMPTRPAVQPATTPADAPAGPVVPVPAAPTSRGPVVRDVPQQ